MLHVGKGCVSQMFRLDGLTVHHLLLILGSFWDTSSFFGIASLLIGQTHNACRTIVLGNFNIYITKSSYQANHILGRGFSLAWMRLFYCVWNGGFIIKTYSDFSLLLLWCSCALMSVEEINPAISSQWVISCTYRVSTHQQSNLSCMILQVKIPD